MGPVPGGLPALTLPSANPALLPASGGSGGLSTCQLLKSDAYGSKFCDENGYDIEPDQDFAALGVANVASAVSQGFAISGADSRTRHERCGRGRTHAVGLVAAAAVALVLLFFTTPLQYVPMAALGAVLVVAGLSLIDIRSVRLFIKLIGPRPFCQHLPRSALWQWGPSTPFCSPWSLPCCALLN